MFLAEDGRPLSLTWHYTPREIWADGVVHALGVVLGLTGAVALVATAVTAHLGPGERAAVVLYAAALVLMLGVSAVYNMHPVGPRKWLLRRADHALIYLMIAATYTPLVALVGSGARAYALLGVIWAVASIGIALKLLLPGRYDRLSIALYLILGWSGVLAYESVIAALQPVALCLLCIGGLLYSIGVVFHVWRRLPFQNAIWHAFVLVATACHYGTIWASLSRAALA
jgi:hemolysin III